MLNLDDLKNNGLVLTGTSPKPAAEPSPEPQKIAMTSGAVSAQVVLSVWRGQRVVVVRGAAGSGKTRLVTEVLAALEGRSGLNVAIICPTRSSAVSTALRLHNELPAGSVRLGFPRTAPGEVPDGVDLSNREAQFVVDSILGAHSRQSDYVDCDVMVFDEANRSRFLDVALAATSADQVLLVGDPAGISRNVPFNTTPWNHLDVPPHASALESFASRDDAEVFDLTTCHRLGPVTAPALGHLYPFPITAGRDANTGGLAEVERFEVAAADHADDPRVMAALVDRARDLMAGGMADGEVALVLPRTSQVAVAMGMMSAAGLTNVAVGTADDMRGREFRAVVALDPCVGRDDVAAAAETGVLCTLVSRHTEHLSWFTDGRAESLADVPEAAAAGVEVRRALA